MNRFRCDKAALEIRMNNSGSAGRFFAGVNGPGARFLFSRGQECAQAEQVIDGANERVHTAIFHPEPAEIIRRFIFAKIDKLAFDLRTDNHGFSREMMPRVIFDCFDAVGRWIVDLV